MNNSLYPVTIFIDRYGDGWFAFKREPDSVPINIISDFLDRVEFIKSSNIIYGYGLTPNDALNDLENKLIYFEKLNPDKVLNT